MNNYLSDSDPFWPSKLSERLSSELPTSITSVNDVRHDRYSKLKVISVYRMGDIYHCETECGKYLWFELHLGSLVMCLAETSYELGASSEPVANYSGGKPTLSQIIKHMKWEIDEENIWNG